MKMLPRAISVGALCFTFTMGSVWANTYYVDVNNPTPSYPYVTWATAATNIQDAVNAATNGDVVFVTNGVYNSGTTVTPLHSCLNRVVITSDITVQSVNGPEHTLIVGAPDPATGSHGTNAVRGVYMSAGVLSGFTITNGHTMVSGDFMYEQSGGGVYLMEFYGETVTVTNCTLLGNSANEGGGGSVGGTLNNCTLKDNTAYAGGGSSGGMLNNCMLTGNRAELGGGSYSGTLNNCMLTGNWATTDGGGSYYGTLNNCTLTGNRADYYGGGCYEGTLTNCIVYYNTAIYVGLNWISFYVTTNLIHCCTTPDPGGTGNITNNPLFVANNDFHLQSGSPCINAGTNQPWMAGATDLDGNPRILDGTVDIGAYEYYPSSIVLNTNDSGPGSLRQAIASASIGDTLSFINTLSGQTILLTNGQLFVDKNLNIDASDLPEGIAIDGNNSSRIFEFATGTTNTLTGLTLTHGVALASPPDNVGGAILVNNNAMLTVTECTIFGNSATYGGGAICNQNDSLIILDHSTLSENGASLGGGIFSDENASDLLNGSTLNYNSADSGGAIFNLLGTNTLNDCTLSGNTASNSAGGIYTYGGAATLNNSTLSGNLAATNGGAIYCYLGSVALNNSTLSANSAGSSAGGIRNNSGTLTLTNSIVAGNSASTYTNIYGSFSGNYNLTSGDPQLAPLGNYGGPTQTMPPLPSSPAIDAGGSTTLTTDQRGFTRVVGIVDIGAVETQPTVVLNTNDSGFGSLRDTVGAAFPETPITFTNILSGQTILLTSGEIYVDRNLNIDASSLPVGIAIDGNHASRIFEFAPGTTNNLIGLTLTRGYASGPSFPDNAGGALLVDSNAVLTVVDSILSGNSATGDGGGIYNSYLSRTTLTNSTLRRNSAHYGGGAIFNYRSHLRLDNSILSSNSAAAGGAIYSYYYSYATIDNSILEDNSAIAEGGAIHNYLSSSLTINHSTLSSNFAGAAGAIENDGHSPLTINNSTLIGNSTDQHYYSYGGAIENANFSPLTINHSTLSGNSSVVEGGAIFNRYYGRTTIVNSTLSGNSSGTSGGAIYNAVYGQTTLNDSTLSINFAGENGGGICNEGTLSVTNSIVAGNSALTFSNNVYGTNIIGANNLTDVDPMLAPLGDYGGLTQTMPPLPGSPAIDAGMDTGSLPATDQRGFPRVVGSAVDIGAVEFQGASDATLVVSPTTLSPGCAEGEEAPQAYFEVWNSGSVPLSYTVSESLDWLSCSPIGGTIAGGTNLVTVDFSTASLTPGTYSGTITITAAGASGSPQTVAVTLTVEESHGTLAWWRFETGPDGNNVIHSAADGVFSADIPDSSGSGNDLSTWSGGGYAGYGYRSDTPADYIPRTGDTNNFSVQNTGGYPCMFTSSNAPIHTTTPPAWTIEVSFKPENGSYRTLVGRDSIGTATNDINLSAFYLQIQPDNSLAIKFCDVSGYWHGAASASGIIQCLAPAEVLIDDFGGNLAAYTYTCILDANGGSTNVASWQTVNGALSINTSYYDGVEQAALTRTDVPLRVGEEIRVDYIDDQTGSRDIGLYVGAATPTPNVREDYLNIYVNNDGYIGSRGFNGTIEFGLVQAGPVTPDSLFIARTGVSTFELGYYLEGSRVVVTNRTMASTTVGNAIGFYADVRAAGTLGSLDNLRRYGLTGRWYHMAAVSDGSTLSLYLNSGSGYDLVAQTDLTLSGSPDTALTAGAGSGSDWTHGTWSVGRGLYAGEHTDRAYGFIDEVRISDTALTPRSFLFSPKPDIVVNVNDSGPGSLRQAITDAASGAIIIFTNTLLGQTILLTSGELYVDKNLTIDASSLPEGIIVDGNANSRIFEFAAGTTNTLTGLTLTNGAALGSASWDNSGGAILLNNSALLNITDSTLSGNSASNWGGAIMSLYSTLRINSCILNGNSATNIGGAIGTLGALAVSNSTLSANTAINENGGGIFISTDGMLTLSDSTLRGNSAGADGGGVYCYGTNSIIGSTFSDNAAYRGGAIATGFGQLIIEDSILSGNSATAGGAIDGSGMLMLNNSSLSNNLADYGGGIYNSGTLVIANSTLEENTATEGGGGIYNPNPKIITITNCILRGNSANNGGGIDANYGQITIINSTVSGNYATDSGGGISSFGTNTIIGCVLSGNSASGGSGGGIMFGSATHTVINSTLTGNSARYTGGVLGISGTLTFINSTVSGNYATDTLSGVGGIRNYGTLTLTNCIVAGNSTASIQDPNISGAFTGSNNLTNGTPLLAPLGNYGGLTQTMPPLPGSPAIDAGMDTGSLPATDQRGFARVVNGTVDIGATEFQGSSDVGRFWSTDWDGDGSPFGDELALGTDPLVADPEAPGHPESYPPDTGNGISFGFNSAATNYTAWVVKRTLDLSDPNSFVEIYRYDGPTGMTTQTNDLSVIFTTNAIQIIDNTTPPPPAAFYELSIEPSP